jgi:hypothetical protein
MYGIVNLIAFFAVAYAAGPGRDSCPLVHLKNQSECIGKSSECWAPNQYDVDCANGAGLCCFDGCANTCYKEKVNLCWLVFKTLNPLIIVVENYLEFFNFPGLLGTVQDC